MPANSLIRRLLTKALRIRKVAPIRKTVGGLGRRIETLEDRSTPASLIPLGNDFLAAPPPGTVLQNDLQIAVKPDGTGYVTVYESDVANPGTPNLYYQLYDANWQAIGSAAPVDPSTSSFVQNNAEISIDNAGNFVIAWETDGQFSANTFDIDARQFGPTGSPLGSSFVVDSPAAGIDQQNPSVSIDPTSGQFVIAWDDEYGGLFGNSKVLAQAYTSDTAIPAVPTAAGIVEVNTPGLEQFGPGDASVAMRSDGSYVVAYDDLNASNQFDGFVRRIGANGMPLDGSDVQLDTAFPGNTSDAPTPKVAVDSAGNYVVVWYSDTSNSGGTGIVQKRFMADGTLLNSSETLVNTAAPNGQQAPVVSVVNGGANDGQYVVAWQSDSGVYYRQFDSITDGGATSSEVQINTTTPGPQEFPTISVDQAGDLVAGFEDESTGTTELRLREFAAPPTVAFNNASESVNENSVTPASIGLTLSGPSYVLANLTTNVSVSTAAGSTAVFGTNYSTTFPQTITFNPTLNVTSVSGTLSVQPLDDNIYDPPGTTLNLSVASTGTYTASGQTTNSLLIANTDAPPLTLSLDGSGDLVLTDGGAIDNNVTVESDTTNSVYDIIETTYPITVSGIAGATGSGTTSVTVPFSSVIGPSLLFNLGGGNNTLNVDYSLGNFSKSIVYDGGGIGGTTDGLVVEGSGTQSATYTPSGTTPGSGMIASPAGSIMFSDLTPVDMTGMATATITFPNANDIVNVADGFDYLSGGTNPALDVTGTSGGIAFESVAVWNDTNVVIDTTTVPGMDAITIANANNTNGITNFTVTEPIGNGGTIAVNGPATFPGTVSLTAANVNSTAAGTITTGTGLMVTISGTTSTLAGTIGGVGGLTEQGTGTLTLSAGNGYSGSTSVMGGTLADGIANALPTGTALTVGAAGIFDLAGFAQQVASITGPGEITDSGTAATFTVNTAAADPYNGTLTGSLNLSVTGTNTLTLDVANSYSGTTSVTGGTLADGIANALPISTALTVTSPGAFDLAGFNQEVASVTGTGTVTNSGATATFLVNNTAADLFAGTLSGTKLALTMSGTGTLTLSGTNTYGGATTISAGALLVNGDDTTATGAVAVNGGVLGGTGMIGGAVTVNTGGTITGATLGGVGTLTVASLSFNGGTYQADLSGDTSDTIVISGGGSVKLKNPTQGIFTLNNLGGTTTAGAVFTFIRNVAAGATAIQNPPLVNANQGGTVSINGQTGTYSYLGGPGATSFTLTTTGPWNISAPGGNVTLKLDSTGTILQELQGGMILDARPVSTITSVVYTDATGTANTLTVDYSGGVAGAGFFTPAVTYNGNSLVGEKLIITGNTFNTVTNTFTTAGPDNSGTIVYDTTGTGMTTDTITYGGLTPIDETGSTITNLVFNLPNGGSSAELKDDGTPGNGISQIDSTGGTAFETTTFNNVSSLTVNGGTGVDTLTLAALPDFTNSLTIGSTVETVNLAASETLTAFNDQGGATVVTATPVTISTATANGNITIANSLDDSTTATDALSLKAGTGTISLPTVGATKGLLSLSSTTTGTGSTTLNGNVTANTITLSGNVSLGVNVQLTHTGTASLSATGGTIALGANTLTDSGTAAGSTGTISDVINGSGGVTVNGNSTSTLTLSAANGYGGATNVTSGTLADGIANALPTGTSLTVGAAGTFDLAGFAQQVTSITGPGVITDSGTAATFTVNTAVADPYDGTLAGTLNLSKMGTNTLTLDAANSYGGTTSVTGGTLADGITDALPTVTALTVGAAGTFDLAGFAQQVTSITGPGIITDSGVAATFTVNTAAADPYNGTLTGSLNLSVTGTNTLTLDAANSYGGTTSDTGGTLAAGIADALPIGTALTVTSPGVFDLAGFNQEVASVTGTGTVANSGAAATFMVNNAAADLFVGTLSGTNLALTMSGTGTLTLSGTNTYGGVTTISAGTLLVNGDDTVATGAVAVNGGVLGGIGMIGGAVTVNTGGTITGGTLGGVGTLTVAILSFNGGTYQADLSGDTADTIVISGGGSVNLKNPTQGIFTLNNLGGTTTAGEVFTLILNVAAGATAIQNPPLVNANEGGTVLINGQTGTYSYITGPGGKNFTLTTTGPWNISAPGGNVTLKLDSTGTILQELQGGMILDARPVSTITSVVYTDATGTANTLTVDYSGGVAGAGFFTPAVTYNGNSLVGEKLIITGNTFNTVTNTFTTTGPDNSGTIVYDPTGTGMTTDTITYGGLTPIDETGSTITNLVFNLPSGGTSALLGDDGTPGNGISQISNTGGTSFETTTFSNPLHLLTINRGSATDTLSVAALPDFTAGLTVGTAAAPLGTVNLNGSFTLNTGAANLVVFAGAINSTAGTATANNINLTATGTVTESGGILSTAGTLTTSSVTGTTLNDPNTVASFNATDASSTGISLIDSTAGGLTVTGISETGGGNVSVTNNTGSITTSTAPISASGAGAVTLTATGATSDIILDTSVTSGSGQVTLMAGRNVTLNAGGISTTGNVAVTGTTGAIDEAGAGLINGALLTTVSATGTMLNNLNTLTSFTATNTTTGNVQLTNTASTLTVTGIMETGGGITVSNTGNLTTSTAAIMDSTAGKAISLTATSGSLTIGAAVTGITTDTIGLTSTGSGNTVAVNAAVTTGMGDITVTSAGNITEMGGKFGTTGLLMTSSVTGTTLGGANTVGSFTAMNTTSGDISLVNTASTLTVTGIMETGGNITVSNTGNLTTSTAAIMDSTAGKAISLTATSGSLTIGAAVTGITTDTIGLTSTGSGNTVAVNAAVTTGMGNITATSAGNITEMGGTFSTMGLLTTSSVTGTTLGGANTVGSFNATNTTSGNVQLTNTASTLTVTGITEMGGGSVTVNNTGSITLSGTVSADTGGNVNLMSTGAISESGAAIVSTTGTLTTNSVTGTTLNNLNTVGTFNAKNTTSGNISLTNMSTPLTVTGITEMGGGSVTVNNTGSIALSGTVSAASGGNVNLMSTGSISESGMAIVNTTGTLTTNSVTGTTLNNPNTVGSFNATNTTSGNISLTNSASTLTVTGITETGGSVMVSNTGNLTTSGAITDNTTGQAINLQATSGSLTLNAAVTGTGSDTIGLTSTGSGNNITVNAAVSTGSGDITVTSAGNITETGGTFSTTGTLTTSSVTGTTLNNANTVGTFNATNTMSGNVSLVNTAAQLTITGISETGGNVSITNQGKIVNTGAITAGSGNIDLTANDGGIGIESTITTAGTLILDPTAGVTQETTLGSMFSASSLTLQGGGTFSLDNPNNTTPQFDANVNGAITLRVNNSLSVDLNNVITNNNNVTIYLVGSFTQEGALNAGTADVLIVPVGTAGDAENVTIANVTAGLLTLGNPTGSPNDSNGEPTNNPDPNEFDVALLESDLNIQVNGGLPDTFPGDSLFPNTAVWDAAHPTDPITSVTFTETGMDMQSISGYYIFTFQDGTTGRLTFQEIETLGNFGYQAALVQVGPQEYEIRLKAEQDGNVTFPSVITGQSLPPNPFILSPNLISPTNSYSAPTLAFGDVSGDGYPDLVIANGPDSAPLVTIINGHVLFDDALTGQTLNLENLPPGALLAQFYAFENPTFYGGLSVAVGDLSGRINPATGLPEAEVVVGAGDSGGPRVEMYDFQNGDTDPYTAMTPLYLQSNPPTEINSSLYNFFAIDPNFRGGVNLAIGDITGSGKPDLIVGAGPGGGPRVEVLNPQTGSIIENFFAYGSSFRGGVLVAAGDLDGRLGMTGQPLDDIATAPGYGGGPQIEVFGAPIDAPLGSQSLSLLTSFFAWSPIQSNGLELLGSAAMNGVGSIAFGATLSSVTQTNISFQQPILVSSARGQPLQLLQFNFAPPPNSMVPISTTEEFPTAQSSTNDLFTELITSPSAYQTQPFTDPLTGAPIDETQLFDGGSVAGFSGAANTNL